MKELFSIGEMSKLFQLPVSTIRYYCDIGIVVPAKVDEKTGYRFFSTEQFERLNSIKYLQALQMPLKEISELLKNRKVESFVSQLEKQKIETERRLSELSEIRCKLISRIEQIRDAVREDRLDCVRELELPVRSAVVLSRVIHPEEDLELSIRILENSSEMESAVFLGKVGLSVSRESLLAGEYGRYRAVFLLVENEAYNHRMGEPLLSGRYVSLRFHGTHRDAPAQYRSIMDYIESRGLVVRGHSVEITLIDYGLTDDPGKFITEIQIPVDSQVT